MYAKQLATQRAAHQTRNVQFKALRAELVEQRTLVSSESKHSWDLENTRSLTKTALHDVQIDNRRLQQQVTSVMDKQAILQSRLASAQNDARAAQTALQKEEEENIEGQQSLLEGLEALGGPEHMPYWRLLWQRLEEQDTSFKVDLENLDTSGNFWIMALADIFYYQEEFLALVNDAAAVAWKQFKVDIAKKKKLPQTTKYHTVRKQVGSNRSRLSMMKKLDAITHCHVAGSLNV